MGQDLKREGKKQFLFVFSLREIVAVYMLMGVGEKRRSDLE